MSRARKRAPRRRTRPGRRQPCRRPSRGWHPRGATPGTSWRPSRISATAMARTTPAPPRSRTHSGRRVGPTPGGSGPLDRLRPRRDRAGRAPEGEKTELEEAMGHVVEAFRFLSARVEVLEGRLAAQDRPVEGAAWLVQARALGALAGPVAAHILARTPGGEIVHADCGDGDLLQALTQRGAPAHGVEPRGAVALRALEHGYTVTIAEASEHLASRADGSTGGVVLSGVVDRLPLSSLLPLLAQSRRVLQRGAPLVVISEPARSHRVARRAGPRPDRRSPAARGDLGALARPGGIRGGRPPARRDRAGPAHRTVGRRPLVSGIHHFVPVLTSRRRRGPAYPAATRGHPCPRLPIRDLRRHRRRRHGGRDGARSLLSRVGRTGRRRRVPVRHGLGHGSVAGRPARDARGQLPQRHAARADGALGQPPGPGAAAGPG